MSTWVWVAADLAGHRKTSGYRKAENCWCSGMCGQRLTSGAYLCFSSLYILRQGLLLLFHWPWRSPIWLGWLASGVQGPAYLCAALGSQVLLHLFVCFFCFGFFPGVFSIQTCVGSYTWAASTFLFVFETESLTGLVLVCIGQAGWPVSLKDHHLCSFNKGSVSPTQAQDKLAL